MIAVEVGLSRTYASLRAAIHFQFVRSAAESELRCAATKSALANVAIQNVEHVLRAQLLANPFGLLKIGEDTWFGKVATVVLETYRLEDETSPPDTFVIPTQSFTIFDDGRFVAGEVPANLAEITLGNCIPTHILSGKSIEATSINFFPSRLV